MMMQLDDSQQEFCQAPIGNLRLLAPAGCGKTLSILYRCKWIAEHSAASRVRFLIVTFTVAAKQELVERLVSDSQFHAFRDNTEITTLNSWGFRRIKNATFNPKLITSKDDYHFAMLNQLQPVWMRHHPVRGAIEQNKHQAPRKLMNSLDAFKSLGFDHVRHAEYGRFVEHLDALHDQGLSWKVDEQLDELTRLGILASVITRSGQELPFDGAPEIYDAFFRFWVDATNQLISNATFTLEDQKYFAYLDERQKIEDGKYLSGAARYDHVLVDEFQDINPLDLALVKAITERNRATVSIVGDDDQAIFEWRGATPNYILDPERYFGSEFSTFTLATNYRSPVNIVDHSQRLISHNKRRVAKKVWSARYDEAYIELRQIDSLAESLDLVYDIVQQGIGGGHSPARVAVIGRKRSQIIPFQVYFASKDVSFCAAEDLQVFMSAAFDRLLRLLMIKSRYALRQTRSQIVDDMLELCNLVKRYPLSKSDREALRRYLQQSGSTTWESAIKALVDYRGSLKGANSNGQMSLNMAGSVAQFLTATTVSDALMKLGENFEGLQLDLGKAEDDVFYVDPPFGQLADFASIYDHDYESFVDDIERAKDQLAYVPPFEDESVPGTPDELWKRPLHLMTALRAKGKEFDTVVLLDVNEGIWPNRNARTPEQIEAERRVFYVAFTRAKKRVVMLVNNRMGNRGASPSRFVEELGLVLD